MMREIIYNALVNKDKGDLDYLRLVYGLNPDMSAIARLVGVSVVFQFMVSTLSYVIGNIIVVNSNLDIYSANKEIEKGLVKILRAEGCL